MKKAIAKQTETEYNEILQQAVAVINETRIKVARQLNIGENAVYWKKYYERFCQSLSKVQQAVALLPWGHILQLMQSIGDNDESILFYATECATKGWANEQEIISDLAKFRRSRKKG